MNKRNGEHEIDIGEEFDRLWESATGGPNAAATASQERPPFVGAPLAPRVLKLEDFRGWFLA